MSAIRVRSRVRVSGPTFDDHLLIVLEDYVQDLISDCKATPEEYPHPPPKPRVTKKGKKRRPKTGLPFYQTGTLIRGITFRHASKGSIRSGVLGFVIAPAGRFESMPRPIAKKLRDRFVDMIDDLHRQRGVGWSRSRSSISKQLVGLIEKLAGGGT